MLRIVAVSAIVTASATADPGKGLSFVSQTGEFAGQTGALRVYDGAASPAGDLVYVYSTFTMGPANPVRYVGGAPEWRPKGAAAPASATKPPAEDSEAALGGFVVHYTDDTSAACRPNPHQFGVPWIRGTYLDAADLPKHR